MLRTSDIGPTGNKASRLSSVNHSAKTIHHHHHPKFKNKNISNIKILKQMSHVYTAKFTWKTFAGIFRYLK